MNYWFAVEKILSAWPDEICCEQPSLIEKAAALLRLERYRESEMILLLCLRQNKEDCVAIWLLCLLHCEVFNFRRALELLSLSRDLSYNNHFLPWSYLRLRCLSAQNYVGSHLSDELSSISKVIEHEGDTLHHQYSLIILALTASSPCIDIDDCFKKFSCKSVLEYQRFKARYLVTQGRAQESVDLLKSLVQRCPSNPGLLIQFSETCLDAQDAKEALYALNRLFIRLGDHVRVLPLLVQVKLLQRHPSLALRASLQLRAKGDLTLRSRIKHQSNQLTSYEATGRVSWFDDLCKKYKYSNENDAPSSKANMIYHLSSIESSSVQSIADSYFQNLPAATWQFASLKSNSERLSPFKIAWITPDVGSHPVSRFLYSFLVHAKEDPNTEHHFVSTSSLKHENTSSLEAFSSLSQVQAHSLEGCGLNSRVDFVRQLDCDVAVDLAGWTGGHFQDGFAQRLAPLQLNYLGYFASTGNPSMDGWVGDQALFPQPMFEWHSEQIIRLSRCFIAWQPAECFPEGILSVTSAPSGPIRFGSFNHNRKLSDATLRVWGRILSQCSDSRLVLKANASSDLGTQTLLRRRMKRQGLNPDQVIWLPLADSHEKHLHQYCEIDVALDCFPNGGCTTTCEALWMGVPVITMSGKSYVGRMSTAVLNGAEMNQYCLSNENDYVACALQQVDCLNYLRQNRDYWRNQIKSTSLGDAADLLRHLVDCFQGLSRLR